MTSINAYKALQNADITGNSIFMRETLTPKVWRDYTSKMKTLGGQWNTSTQSHDFKRNPAMLVERLLSLGSTKFNKFSLYETPASVFDYLWEEHLERFFYSKKTLRILEPSVGCGSLVLQLLAKINSSDEFNTEVDFTCYEIDPINVEFCKLNGINVTQANFLDVAPDASYDIVLMNPPFERLNFAKHIEHARGFLTPRGKLFSIAPVTPFSEMHELSTLLNPKSDLHSAYHAARKSNWAFCQEQFAYNAFKGAKVRTTVVEIDNEELNRTSQDENSADLLFLSNTNAESLTPVIDLAINKAQEENRPMSLLDFQLQFVEFLFRSNTPEKHLKLSHSITVQLA